MIDTILGIRISTLAIPIPIPKIVVGACLVSNPRKIPTIRPTNAGSPKKPNFSSSLFMSMSMSFTPGIWSISLLIPQDKGYINVVKDKVEQVVPSRPKKSCHLCAIACPAYSAAMESPTVIARPSTAFPQSA